MRFSWDEGVGASLLSRGQTAYAMSTCDCSAIYLHLNKLQMPLGRPDGYLSHLVSERSRTDHTRIALKSGGKSCICLGGKSCILSGGNKNKVFIIGLEEERWDDNDSACLWDLYDALEGLVIGLWLAWVGPA